MELTLNKLDNYLKWCTGAIEAAQHNAKQGNSLETQLETGASYNGVPLKGQLYNFAEVTIEPSLQGFGVYLHAIYEGADG